MRSIQEIHQLVANEIEKLQFKPTPANLYEPISYILSLGGKRLRPILALLTYQLSGKDAANITKEALAIEVFHNFTLMHDDIMDEAPLRRGQPTVHEKWNQTVAILSGDTMLVKAYDLLLQAPVSNLADLLLRFNQTATEVCEGQQIDMDFETRVDVTEIEYLEMIRLKTAVLLGFSMELGGKIAGFSDDVVNKLYQIGENMGIGFQLMDDYLDVYGDASKFGKQVGGDILANKKTYLLITAFAKANPTQLQSLESWISKNSYTEEDKIEAVTTLYNEIGIPELTRMKMNAYFDEALSLLNKLDIPTSGKQLLIDFILQLMKRDK